MFRKITTLAVAALTICCASAQEVKPGDKMIDLGIGLGDANGAMFTQRLNFEWILNADVINENFAVGLGFQINNAYGAKRELINVGTFNYDYTLSILKKPQQGASRIDTQKINRQGSGFAKTDASREDVSFMPTVSLHGNFVKNLDLYVTFGLGIGVMNYIKSDYTAINLPGLDGYTGFNSANYSNISEVGSETWITSYSYNDIEHAKWSYDYGSKAVFSTAFFVGARYFFNEKWGVNAQLGLLTANVKKSYGNSYNVFSIGATYRF